MSAPKEQKTRSWQLQHGITFEIQYPRQPPPIATLAYVFTQYLQYLHEHRREYEFFTEPELPVAYATEGRKFYANCHLYYLGENLPTDTWIQAVIAAIAAADTVRQIMEDAQSWRARIVEDQQRQPGADMWLLEAVDALGKKGGDLDAFEILLKRANTQLLKP